MSSSPPTEPSHSDGSTRRWAFRGVLLLVTFVSLYLLLPSLVEVFSSWRSLTKLNPWWAVAAVPAEVASFGATWLLQRIALRTTAWFPVGASQLAATASSRIVPGGGATSVAIQLGMLGRAGIGGGRAAAALAAAGALTTGALLALPILSLPAILGGVAVAHSLELAAYLGLAVLALLVTAGSWFAPRTSLLEGFVGFMALWIAAELVARETSRARVAAALALGALVLAAVALFASGWAAALVLLGCALIAGGLLPMTGTWVERRELWVASAAMLGFLDGFVLPAEVAPAQPPSRALLAMSFGFDVGAFIAAALLVVLAAGALLALRRRKIELPLPLLTDLAATVLGGCGAFWIVTRLYG